MLGVRLKPATEVKLDRHARAVGRPKSSLVRDWIEERLEHDSVDAQVQRAAEHIARHEANRDRQVSGEATSAFLRMLDNLDGGYEWGPEGPPA